VALSVNIKTIIIAVLIALLIAGYAIFAGRVDTANANVARLESALSDCKRQEHDIGTYLERQNAAIEAVRVDTVYVDRQVKSAEKKYVEIREAVVRSMGKDSSCENKVNNIDAVLRRFHGAELYAPDSD